MNGIFPSGPAAGIRNFYPGPYYAWYNETSTEEIRASHEWLVDYMRKNGPYDGVMGFSQGSGLLASFLLYHDLYRPDEPLPFKVAIFICGGITMPVIADTGMEVSVEAEEWDQRSRIMLQQRASLLDTDALSGIDPWVPSPPSSGSESDDEAEDLDIYFRMHHPEHFASSFNDFASLKLNPDTLDRSDVFGLDFTRNKMNRDVKIRIPTVHIYGSKDPRYPAGIQLTQFCEKSLRQCYDHRGGHEIPRSKKASETIAELVDWSAAMAGAME